MWRKRLRSLPKLKPRLKKTPKLPPNPKRLWRKKKVPIELQIEVENCPEGLEEFLAQVAETCFEIEGISGAGFAVRIVDDEAIRTLNREMRNIDKSTDVLSFPTVSYRPGKTAKDHPK
ncbi:MAG: rRNA maturation RNAse YbeY, partial [Clostridia bacterium]|nr:rRNA maturation RNAse YbeY [Clostridia bacterium]